MMLVPTIGFALVLLAIVFDIAVVVRSYRAYLGGRHESTVPFVSLLASMPGGLMLALWYGLFYWHWLAVMSACLLSLNLLIHIAIPMILTVLVKK